MGLETCENCGRTIGKLEQAYIHNNKVVCKECNELLHIKTKQDEPTFIAKNLKTTQTIEKTAKEWKAGVIVGIIMMLLSIPSCYAGNSGAGGGLFFVGAITFIIGRIGAYWYHG